MRGLTIRLVDESMDSRFVTHVFTIRARILTSRLATSIARFGA